MMKNDNDNVTNGSKYDEKKKTERIKLMYKNYKSKAFQK